MIEIESLIWDTLPGGALVSTVNLWGVGDLAENPDPDGEPLTGPASIEYRLVEGRVSAAVNPPQPRGPSA